MAARVSGESEPEAMEAAWEAREAWEALESVSDELMAACEAHPPTAPAKLVRAWKAFVECVECVDTLAQQEIVRLAREAGILRRDPHDEDEAVRFLAMAAVEVRRRGLPTGDWRHSPEGVQARELLAQALRLLEDAFETAAIDGWRPAGITPTALLSAAAALSVAGGGRSPSPDERE